MSESEITTLDIDLPPIEFESPGRFAVHNPASEIIQPQAWDPAPYQLGEHRDLLRFKNQAEIRAHALAFLQQARRSLCIYSTDLEAWLYHHSSVQQACTEFLLAHPKNRLRILVQDAGAAVRNGHRLVNLARRLPSNCQIRKLDPDQPVDAMTYLLADADGVLMRPKPAEWMGTVTYHDPGRGRQRQAHFDQAWETSLSEPNLRSFLL